MINISTIKRLTLMKFISLKTILSIYRFGLWYLKFLSWCSDKVPLYSATVRDNLKFTSKLVCEFNKHFIKLFQSVSSIWGTTLLSPIYSRWLYVSYLWRSLPTKRDIQIYRYIHLYLHNLYRENKCISYKARFARHWNTISTTEADSTTLKGLQRSSECVTMVTRWHWDCWNRSFGLYFRSCIHSLQVYSSLMSHISKGKIG